MLVRLQVRRRLLMQSLQYSEFIGISPRTATLIEARRLTEDEPKDAILLRTLTSLAPPKDDPETLPPTKPRPMLDLGQGAELVIGEKVYLFLSGKALKANKPDGTAYVRENGFEIDGRIIPKSRNSYHHPAMVEFQKKKGHRNEKGQIISLSAWRQWYVERDGRFVPLLDLKDEALARTRGPSEYPFTLADFE
jgi:hypothetical protein